MKTLFISILIVAMSSPLFAQTLTQTVKGKITEAETQSPVIGATVVIVGSSPQLGAMTDADGVYRIANVPVGRHSISVSSMGFEAQTITEVLVSSGKELQLNIGMKQSSTELKEVAVSANIHKDQPLNTMASISARSFSVEDTRRYAGGLDDPARMASAFAGVAVGNIQDNAIVIRGNAPKGVSWRLEGIDIPNPNHFAGGNVAGGGFVTIFSSQMLSNSDFYTGAFPAEYSNALAGVFDMKLRTGNSEKREHAVQVGVMGIDLSSEGPFSKNSKATYLFNYRYSTMSLLSALKIIPSDQIPKYQDFSFKCNFPTKRLGTFSLWGVGAVDENAEPVDRDSLKWKFDWDRIRYMWTLNMGTAGLTHKINLGQNTLLTSTLAASGVENTFDGKRLDDQYNEQNMRYLVDNSGKLTFNSVIKHRLAAQHTIKAGVTYKQMFYNLSYSSTLAMNKPDTYQNYIDEQGKSATAEAYVQYKYDITPRLTANVGLSSMYFALNNNATLEPRAGLRYQLAERHSLSFGYGRHTQMEELKVYLVKDVNGNYLNKNLGFATANHFVLGYDWSLSRSLRLKVEPYVQLLTNFPGLPNSSYSMLNFESDMEYRNGLANNSEGRNIGIDITLERFLSNNFYYLFTASLFDSKYRGDDGVWRNTLFNKQYVFNALVGKEFQLRNNKALGVNLRFNYLGGNRTTPYLEAESLAAHEVVYDNTRRYETKQKDTYYLDATLTYRINKQHHTSTWALQVKNALGSPSDGGYDYNYRTHSIESQPYTVVVPVISYKLEF